MGSSVVLLNGVLGKIFKCRRGVGHGDSLSPLLFVIVAALLQVLINKVATHGLLRAPILLGDNEFPIIQYADDTLPIQAYANKLFFLKALLNSYETTSGLRVNFRKS